MPTYYPYFFSNQNIPEESVNFPLVQNTSVDGAKACVCVGYANENGELKYVDQAYLESNDLHFASILSEATEQVLTGRDAVEWENIVFNWEGEDISILRKKGDFLTASEVLNPVMLQELEEFFDCHLMSVALPNQNEIYVAAVPGALASMIHKEFSTSEANGSIAVSNMIYLSHKGEIIASAEVDATEYEVESKKPGNRTRGKKDTARRKPKKKFTVDKSRLK